MEKIVVCGEGFYPMELQLVEDITKIPGFEEVRENMLRTSIILPRGLPLDKTMKAAISRTLSDILLRAGCRAHFYTRSVDDEGTFITLYGFTDGGVRAGAFAQQIEEVL